MGEGNKRKCSFVPVWCCCGQSDDKQEISTHMWQKLLSDPSGSRVSKRTSARKIGGVLIRPGLICTSEESHEAIWLFRWLRKPARGSDTCLYRKCTCPILQMETRERMIHRLNGIFILYPPKCNHCWSGPEKLFIHSTQWHSSLLFCSNLCPMDLGC